MSTITIDQIKALREATGVGILDCRKALEAANGDYDQAYAALREKGLAKAAKRADRVASEGVVELYSHGDGRVGVMVEVNTETDFVGRSDNFRHLAHELALHIAAMAPKYVREEDIPEVDLEELRASARAQALEEGKPENIVDRIVEGKVKKFQDEACLLNQAYVRDDSKTVNDLLLDTIAAMGENIVIRRFARWELGEEASK
jgi:elongation factor Ts